MPEEKKDAPKKEGPKLQLKTYGEKILKKKARPVEQITDEIRDLAGRMIGMMYEEHGVGLAANQVGVDLQLFVADTSGGTDMSKLIIMVNPKFLRKEEMIMMEEGCLSVPGFRAEIFRANQVTVEGMDLNGKVIRLSGEGLAAQAFQHEIDHLNGILFVDHLPFFQKIKYWKELRGIKKKTQQRLQRESSARS